MKRLLYALAPLVLIACGSSSVSSHVTQPVVLSTYEPDYPENVAVNSGVSPSVVVEGTVDTDGFMRNAHAVGLGDTRLEQEAVEAAEKYRFRPGMIDGVPQEMDFRITVNFRRRGRY